MTAPTLLLVCQAGPERGFGHLMRCRGIADHARAGGIASVLVGPDPAYRVPADAERFAEWIALSPAGDMAGAVEAIPAIAERFGARHAMLDDYTIDGPAQAMLRAAGLRCLRQYDASRPLTFAAHLAVNASPAESRDLHIGRLMDEVEFLNGPDYAVLRPEFGAIERRPAGRPAKRALVTFGGGDDRGAIRAVLEALAETALTPIVMTGAHNPNVPVLREALSGGAELHVSPPDVPGLMAGCDLAVMGGGTSIYEAAYCGLPMLLVSIADNQRGQCEGWQRLGAAVYLGHLGEYDAADLARALDLIMGDDTRRRAMARAGMDAVDGHGAARLLDALMGYVTSGSATLGSTT